MEIGRLNEEKYSPHQLHTATDAGSILLLHDSGETWGADEAPHYMIKNLEIYIKENKENGTQFVTYKECIMSIETILHYIDIYGYFIIFLFLFFGIVGIPAPEESLLFLIGVFSVHHQLSFGRALLSAILGAFIGMFTAYICGKYIGLPFIKKYGKYVGITNERWEKVSSESIREMSRKPFSLASICQASDKSAPTLLECLRTPFFRVFFLFSFLGTLAWTTPIYGRRVLFRKGISY